jgi:hypothetical protein
MFSMLPRPALPYPPIPAPVWKDIPPNVVAMLCEFENRGLGESPW